MSSFPVGVNHEFISCGVSVGCHSNDAVTMRRVTQQYILSIDYEQVEAQTVNSLIFGEHGI